MISQTERRARERNTLQFQSRTEQVTQFNPLVFFPPDTLSLLFSSALDAHV